MQHVNFLCRRTQCVTLFCPDGNVGRNIPEHLPYWRRSVGRDWCTFICIFTNGLYQRHFTQECNVQLPGQRLCSTLSEEIVSLVRELIGCEVGHVLDNAQHRYTDLVEH